MVLANEGGHADRATEIRSIASKIGCSRESLRRWVVQAEGADQNRHLSSRFAAGGRPGDRIGALDVLSALRFRSAIAPSVDEALRRPVKTARYLALRYTERLANAGSATSVGSVGDSDDNALAETIIGLCKAEMIHRRTPWATVDAVEWETLRWVDWLNHRRLLGPIRHISPAEAERAFHDTAPASIWTHETNQWLPVKPTRITRTVPPLSMASGVLRRRRAPE